tara:strand:+ start:74 stop:682 length:609 start_codon:yes stop_codon:yes gene_type:complete
MIQESFWEKNELASLENCHISLFRKHFSESEADKYFFYLNQIKWKQNEIVVFGNKHPEPRETAWFGNPGINYKYSGIEHTAEPWFPLLEEIRTRVQIASGVIFNSVLLNRYRDENDGVGWHADDERELGATPTIGSVSFGASRKFQLREKHKKSEIFTTFLHHGDLLIMHPPTQQHWLHCVPKSRKKATERINLTFREIIAK